MGRQLPIVTTPIDERNLLEFILTLSPLSIYLPFAETIDALWVKDWRQHNIEGCGFYTWLQSYTWVPEYKQTGDPRCPNDRRGLWYVSNDSGAPVIQISRPVFNSTTGGRIYWTRDLSSPSGYTYDSAEFLRQIDRIWNWIRRNSHRKISDGRPNGSYYLPEAWRQLHSH